MLAFPESDTEGCLDWPVKEDSLYKIRCHRSCIYHQHMLNVDRRLDGFQCRWGPCDACHSTCSAKNFRHNGNAMDSKRSYFGTISMTREVFSTVDCWYCEKLLVVRRTSQAALLIVIHV